ncbi:MAG: Twin-arginine translocation pathway signal [Candidatus Puniceispirillaceae bacterium]
MSYLKSLTRRDLLKSGIAAGSLFIVGGGFIAAPNAAWAMEVTHLQPGTMATLVQMARDVYPHDQISDEFYAAAMKGYDTADAKAAIEDGVAALNAAAVGQGYASYLDIGWERDRVDVLRSMDSSPFFQTIRGGLITGLYNQKEVWPLFGYEGESFSKGGYIDRGFNDIKWV